MGANLVKWLIYLSIIATILTIGWSQPLRYRFLSTEEVYFLEHPIVLAPPPPPTPEQTRAWMFSPGRQTPLDSYKYR